MFDVTRYAKAADEIVDAGRFLYQRGWSPATSSNYSARIDDQHIAITVSGRHKGELAAGDVMVVDLAGQPVQSSCRSSAETRLHTVLYEVFSRGGRGAAHSLGESDRTQSVAGAGRTVGAGKATNSRKAFTGVDTHESVLSVPVFDNTQDIDALARDTQVWFAEHPDQPGYLIRGHGLYTWGKTMADCLRHVEAFEFLFECELETMRVRP